MTTTLDPYGKSEPIGTNPTIRHRFADGSEITLRLDEDRICVTDSSLVTRHLLIEPVASNVISIRVSR